MPSHIKKISDTSRERTWQGFPDSRRYNSGMNQLRLDPSRTGLIRRAFAKEMQSRFDALRLAVLDEGWTKEVTSLEFIGATSQIVTSAGDNRVRIVTDDGAEVRAITKVPDYVQAAASTASGGTIIGGGEDSELRVWDGTNGKELAAFGSK